MSAEARVLALRTAPPAVFGGRRSARLLERNLIVYRHTWVIIFSGFFEPIFYLFSIGIGIGHLVGDLDGVSYRAFVAPALLASSSMNGAIYESTMNIFHKLRYAKTYDAMLATPIGPRDVAVGEITWCLIRGALYGMGFLVVMTAMGLIQSWWGLAALPAAVLIGFAFAATGMAGTTYVRTWADFEIMQLLLTPLFLFSATFFPLSTYPAGLRFIVQITPLYQGVALIRSLTLGTVGPGQLLNIVYLLVMGAAGLLITSRRLGTLLLQ
ncbi:MAG TPA: ABC transporter permease [Acidimicrobiales bacterium]